MRVEDGLEAALREEARLACNRAALASCEVVSELEGRLDRVVEAALFRVAQQALANVVDHARATHALVAIECTARHVLLRVSDDGCGFDPDHVQVLADGADAVARAKQLDLEVVLMDLRMPVLSGLDATPLIKEACPATQVVLLSAFESPALAQRAEEPAASPTCQGRPPPATCA